MSAGTVQVTGAVQFAAWQSRRVPPVEQLGPDLWSIPVPLPDSPLRYVNVYAMADDREVVLVDAGWDDEDAWTALQDGLATFGATVADVSGVLISHLHFDHLGLARRVKEASGAWVAMHEADRAVLSQADHRVPARARELDKRFLCSLGASPGEADESVGSLEELSLFAQVLLPERILHHQDRLEVPGRVLTVIHTPGHTPGHVCLFDGSGRQLFAGDHLLPRITPNVSVHRSWGRDPLSDYLRSLEAVAQLDVGEVFPAHEWRYSGSRGRADAIAAHHDARSRELVDIVRRMPERTPWDLAAELSWSRPWSQYEGRMRVAAVTETAAHLNHLVARGLVNRTGDAVATFTVREERSVPDGTSTRSEVHEGFPAKAQLSGSGSARGLEGPPAFEHLQPTHDECFIYDLRTDTPDLPLVHLPSIRALIRDTVFATVQGLYRGPRRSG